MFLGIIFFLELTAGVLAFVFKDWIKDQLYFFINNNIRAYRDDIDLQNLIDFTQEYVSWTIFFFFFKSCFKEIPTLFFYFPSAYFLQEQQIFWHIILLNRYIYVFFSWQNFCKHTAPVRSGLFAHVWLSKTRWRVGVIYSWRLRDHVSNLPVNHSVLLCSVFWNIFHICMKIF